MRAKRALRTTQIDPSYLGALVGRIIVAHGVKEAQQSQIDTRMNKYMTLPRILSSNPSGAGLAIYVDGSVSSWSVCGRDYRRIWPHKRPKGTKLHTKGPLVGRSCSARAPLVLRSWAAAGPLVNQTFLRKALLGGGAAYILSKTLLC